MIILTRDEIMKRLGITDLDTSDSPVRFRERGERTPEEEKRMSASHQKTHKIVEMLGGYERVYGAGTDLSNASENLTR